MSCTPSLDEEPACQGTNAGQEKQGEKPCYGFIEGGWKFDQKMVDNFKSEMKGHIPGWAEVLALCSETVVRIHGNGARILSFWVGCGIQFEDYLQRGWDPEKLFGINYSEPLHNLVLKEFPSVTFRLVPEHTRPYDPSEDGPFDVVQMLWSLHFEHPREPERRAEVLSSVFQSLSPGGIFILSEKTTQTPEMAEAYYEFKRQQGVPEEVIQAKKAALVGVLETLPKEWYETALMETGFTDTCVLHSRLGFVTWLARKPRTSPVA